MRPTGNTRRTRCWRACFTAARTSTPSGSAGSAAGMAKRPPRRGARATAGSGRGDDCHRQRRCMRRSRRQSRESSRRPSGIDQPPPSTVPSDWALELRPRTFAFQVFGTRPCGAIGDRPELHLRPSSLLGRWSLRAAEPGPMRRLHARPRRSTVSHGRRSSLGPRTDRLGFGEKADGIFSRRGQIASRQGADCFPAGGRLLPAVKRLAQLAASPRLVAGPQKPRR